jgi:hypothetical protein
MLTRIPIPPVGLFVQWFEHGDMNRPPYPACVMTSSDRGNIDLMVLKLSGSNRTVRGVWWSKDPALEGKDHMTRSARGCWDFVPGLDIEQCGANHTTAEVEDLREMVTVLRAEVDVLKQKAKLSDLDELEQKILELSESNTPVEVGEKVGCTYQRVLAVLRKHRPEES